MQNIQIHFETSRNYLHYRLPRHISHELGLGSRSINGIDVLESGKVVRFNREVFSEPMAILATGVLTGLQLFSDPFPASATLSVVNSQPVGRALDATKEDLDIINANHSVKALKAEDVRIYERFVVNNAPTRNLLWFTNRALQKFASDYDQGRSRLLYHDKTKIVGRTFSASVVEGKKIRGIEADWVRVKEYILNTPANAETILNVDGGIYAFDSIGFAGGVLDVVEVPMGDKSRYYLQIDFDPNEIPALEAGEVSYVFMGAVFGAGNDRQQQGPVEGSGVDSLGGDVPTRSNNNQNEEVLWLG